MLNDTGFTNNWSLRCAEYNFSSAFSSRNKSGDDDGFRPESSGICSVILQRKAYRHAVLIPALRNFNFYAFQFAFIFFTNGNG